jgi:hypothetical protein
VSPIIIDRSEVIPSHEDNWILPNALSTLRLSGEGANRHFDLFVSLDGSLLLLSDELIPFITVEH